MPGHPMAKSRDLLSPSVSSCFGQTLSEPDANTQKTEMTSITAKFGTILVFVTHDDPFGVDAVSKLRGFEEAYEAHSKDVQ